MKLSDIVKTVRDVVQDNEAPVRYNDDMLVKYANLALRRCATLRPDLFSHIGPIDCQAGVFYQKMPSDSVRMVEIYAVKGGGALTEVDREFMTGVYPEWSGSDPGLATEYMRHPRNPNMFFLNPPAPESQELIAEYVKVPKTYSLPADKNAWGEEAEDDIELLPDSYEPVIVDATVFMVESMNDESVDSGRAELYLNSFTQMLGVSAQGRVLTDKEDSGIGEEGEDAR